MYLILYEFIFLPRERAWDYQTFYILIISSYMIRNMLLGYTHWFQGLIYVCLCVYVCVFNNLLLLWFIIDSFSFFVIRSWKDSSACNTKQFFPYMITFNIMDISHRIMRNIHRVTIEYHMIVLPVYRTKMINR